MVRYLGEDQGLDVLVEEEELTALRDSGVAASMPYAGTWGPQDEPDLHCYVDFVVCLGGDGLVLHATHLFGCAIPPIISFRLGSLGFLTPHEFDDMREHLDNVINGADVSLLDFFKIFSMILFPTLFPSFFQF